MLIHYVYLIVEPHTFELDNDDVEVTFLRNGTPMASISFEVSQCV